MVLNLHWSASTAMNLTTWNTSCSVVKKSKTYGEMSVTGVYVYQGWKDPSSMAFKNLFGYTLSQCGGQKNQHYLKILFTDRYCSSIVNINLFIGPEISKEPWTLKNIFAVLKANHLNFPNGIADFLQTPEATSWNPSHPGLSAFIANLV